jgi:DNA-binding XRE family transcriptional regulator
MIIIPTKMAKRKKVKVYTLDEVTDELIGKRGTVGREKFEMEVQLARIGDAIRALRKNRQLTQEQLGELIGVQKAQISKLESNSGNVTLETVLRVFAALKADVTFNIHTL